VHGRVKRCWIRNGVKVDLPGTTTGNAISGSIYWWFDGRSPSLNADEVSTFTGGSTDDSDFLELECQPARQKCNQFRVSWVDSQNPGYSGSYAMNPLIGLAFDAQSASSGRGAIRTTSGSWRTS